MFEALGFQQLIKYNKQIPRKSWNYQEFATTYYDGYYVIKFYETLKYYKTIVFKNSDDDDREHTLGIRLHLAITQQMKELGWL